MIDSVITKYKNCDFSDIDTLIDILIDLENIGIEEVYVNNKYFKEPKQITGVYKSIGACVHLSILDMNKDEAISLIKKEKELNGISYVYEV